MPKQLVIDTSVARASGGTPSCTKFLKAVLNNSYHVTMSPFIRDEWQNNQSEFAFLWRSQMISRDRFHVIGIKPNNELRTNIECSTPDCNCKKTMLKDISLIETALETDKIVISLDDRARKLFAHASALVCVISIIVWVNPSKVNESPIHWLENGAEAELERQLSHLFDGRIRNKQESKEDFLAFGIFMTEACLID